MKAYEFEVTVEGLDINDDEVLDALYEMDFLCQPGSIDGVVTIWVRAEGESDQQAFRGFREALESSTPVRIVSIDEDLVNLSEIAERLGVSRETPRQWINNKPGTSMDFPKHHAVIGSGRSAQRVWRWVNVYCWCERTGRKMEVDAMPLSPTLVSAFNLAHSVERAQSREIAVNNEEMIDYNTILPNSVKKSRFIVEADRRWLPDSRLTQAMVERGAFSDNERLARIRVTPRSQVGV